ncbi:MAG: peptidoglycan-binding protein, partial [Erysipelotrichaceae bacterium]|nr:peptidoglycan-binding protein [Erysipelotrichaceae bacterium]
KQGDIKEYRTLPSHPFYTFDQIVVLINQNTASASEVLTAALKEYKDVSIVGVKSYGKGTVQVPLLLNDGSIFKYTTAQWLTPNGNKINGVGISPDYEIKLDEALTVGGISLNTEERYEADTVSRAARLVQIYLKFLGYNVDRNDEYFSLQSSQALRSYQQDMGLEVDGVISDKVVASLLSSCAKKWREEKSVLDVQMKKAMEVVHGR